MQRPVFFTGMPGSGKTTIGKLFAKNLSLPFYDLDELIETSEKKTIQSIFTKYGEDHFRRRVPENDPEKIIWTYP